MVTVRQRAVSGLRGLGLISGRFLQRMSRAQENRCMVGHDTVEAGGATPVRLPPDYWTRSKSRLNFRVTLRPLPDGIVSRSPRVSV